MHNYPINLDGFIARKFNMISDFGKIIDPVADKLTLIAVGICVMIAEPMVLPVVVILMLKDLLMLIGASVLLRKKVKPCAAEWYGKVGTICFYVSVVSIVPVTFVVSFVVVVLSSVPVALALSFVSVFVLSVLVLLSLPLSCTVPVLVVVFTFP